MPTLNATGVGGSSYAPTTSAPSSSAPTYNSQGYLSGTQSNTSASPFAAGTPDSNSTFTGNTAPTYGANGQATSTGSKNQPKSAYTIVTPTAAQDNLNTISTNYANLKNGINNQITNNAANNSIPTMPGYNVSATPNTGQGVIQVKSNSGGQTYYATPTTPQKAPVGDVITAINNSTTGTATGDTTTPTGSTTSTIGTSATGTPTGTTPSTAPNPSLSPTDQATVDALNATGTIFGSAAADAYTTWKGLTSQMVNGVFPLNSVQQTIIDTTNQAFDNLNKIATQRAAMLSSQFGTVGQKINATGGQLLDLQLTKSNAIAKLEEGFQTDDATAVKNAWDQFTSAETGQTDALTKVQTIVHQAAADAQAEVDKQTTAIQGLVSKAAAIGADSKTLAAMTASGSYNDAINASNGYLQTATGTLGDYLQYKRDAESKGLTPVDYQTFSNNDAYNKAYEAEAGKTAGDAATSGATNGTDPTLSGLTNGNGQDILAATGLSYYAFQTLIGNTSALTRMSAAQKAQYAGEVSDWAQKNGIDISTFKTQYSAANDVLNANIQRAANTKVFAGEVEGSADALASVINNSDLKSLGGLKAADIAALVAGKQINNPTAMKYSTQLQAMTNDYAGYLAASRGASAPDDSDLASAANVISNGLSSGSVDAFKSAIVANEQKVAGVVNNEVNSARQSVWSQFGVGGEFVPTTGQDPGEAVNQYIAANPDAASTTAALYKIPGWTDQKVLNYLTAAGKIGSSTSDTSNTNSSTSSGRNFWDIIK